jgi:acid phosphatase class B
MFCLYYLNGVLSTTHKKNSEKELTVKSFSLDKTILFTLQLWVMGKGKATPKEAYVALRGPGV